MKSFCFALVCAITTYSLMVNAAPWQPEHGLEQVAIWPNGAPGGQIVDGPEGSISWGDVAGRPWVAAYNVVNPTITVYPPKGKNTGAAIVVFPGGGYQVLAIDLEGTEVCDWVTSIGVSCVLLKYRVPYGKPNRSGPYGVRSSAALQDAQRTLGLLRRDAAKWKIDPKKIGVIGFSAGGHLVAAISTNYKKRLYPSVDVADKESCRPDFAIPIYPGHIPKNYNIEEGLSPFLPVTSDTPPTLLIHAQNDEVDPVEYSLLYYAALKKHKVPVEMHLYAEGGHAFGLRRTKFPITNWPELAEKWLVTIGMLPK